MTGAGYFPPGTTREQAADICKSGGSSFAGTGAPCMGFADYNIKLGDGRVYPYVGCTSVAEAGGSGIVRVL